MAGIESVMFAKESPRSSVNDLTCLGVFDLFVGPDDFISTYIRPEYLAAICSGRLITGL